MIHSDSLSANHENQVLELHSQVFEIKNETVCNELPSGHSEFVEIRAFMNCGVHCVQQLSAVSLLWNTSQTM